MSTARLFPTWKRISAALTIVLLAACGGEDSAPAEAVGGSPSSGEVAIAMLTPGQVAQKYQDFLVNVFLDSPCSKADVNNAVHDCQRLILNDQGRTSFGPLVGILPTPAINGNAVIFNNPTAVAYIVNAGPMSGTGLGYPPLKIEGGSAASPTKHCLWLHNDNGTWKAAMSLPGATSGIHCEPVPTDWTQLDVVRQSYSGSDIDTYPGTARWQWTDPTSSRNGEHYIGVKCADGWCAIGSRGFTPVAIPQRSVQPDSSRAIPGYFDAQFLAVKQGQNLVPGPWGAVYPVGVPGNWDGKVPLTTAAFDINPGTGFGTYVKKLNLRGGGGGPVNGTSWLKLWATASSANPASAVYKNFPTTPGKKARNVTADALNAHGPSDSARWQWRDNDETVWVPCPWGCCEVEDAGDEIW